MRGKGVVRRFNKNDLEAFHATVRRLFFFKIDRHFFVVRRFSIYLFFNISKAPGIYKNQYC